VTRELPASSFQERIWLAGRLEPDLALYNVPMAWRTRGALDPARLRRALALLVERHEILRTRFVERGGRLRQEVGEPWEPDVAWHDLGALPAGEREERLQAWLAAAARRRFDPGSGRLLAAALLGLGGEQVLFLCVHHLVWDEPSTAVLLRELERCYAATAAGTEGARTATPHQERMAFVDRFERGVVYETAPTYHDLPLLLRLAAVPDRAALHAALTRVMARHEALRTTLVLGDDGLVQRVSRDSRVDLRWLETAPAGDDLPAALLGWTGEPFDLAEGPLFRAAVQPRADGGAWLGLLGHQAVVDRASLAIVAGEVQRDLAGRPPAGTGSSYAGWWEGRDRDREARDLAALTEHLRGGIEPLLLPGRPRPAVHVYEERSVALDLGPGADRTELAAREGVTVDDVLLGGFLALLSLYSGQDQLVVGTMQDRRDEPGAAGVVGPLANLLPLRLHVPTRLGFRALIGRVAAERVLAGRHAAAPFDELVRRLRPATDMSRTALFDVLFQRAEAPEGRLEPGGGHGKYDLHFFLQGDRRGLLVYNGVLFDEPWMRSMAGHFARLLDQAVREPDTAVGDLDPLNDDERRLQLVHWNATAAGFPSTTVHGLVRERALAQPDAVALVHGTERRSYRELLQRAERLARGLVAAGVRPGELVAVVQERGLGQVEAMLAALLAGAAYLPVERAAPEARTAFVLRDARARWAIVDGAVPAGFAGRALTLDELERGGEAALPDVGPSALAYCIYTSGTTGGPKGVLVTHRSVVRLLRSDRFPFDFGPADAWSLFHSCAFDFSVWEVFGCLSSGGRLVVVPAEEARDAQRFRRLLRRERVTVLNQTPGAFAELLRVEEAEPDALEHLRYVVFGGDRLQLRQLAGFMQRHPHVRLVNMYGITEATVHVTWRQVAGEDVQDGVSNVGVPLPATTVHLLDPRTGRRLLPAGVVGEIHVGGPGVAAGYLRRPGLEAERFVPDPFGRGRLYRSGDLARYRPDGTLEFLGRRDAQVKLRGYRIEPEEIASALREHPSVVEAVVLKEGGADGRLVAFVRAPDRPPGAVELRSHLGERLPEYMVPAAYLTVDRVPLTENGKLDEGALRARATRLPTAAGREPATPTARALAAIWSELLGGSASGADDSFFELGGHSLLATRLLGRVAEELGVGLPLRRLFEHPRLQELADLIDRDRRDGEHEAPAEGLAPASSFQRRVWLTERLEPGAARYNVPQTWRVAGRLDPGRLRRALGLVVERHEILRTRFVERRGRLRQALAAPWAPELEREDLTALPPEERDRRLEAWSLEAVRRPFDLASGRLLRAALADLGEREQALSLCFHHQVWDAGSVPVFLEELARCYEAAGGRVEQLPAPGRQYRDLVAAQLADQESERGARALDRAVSRLEGAPPYLAVPTPPPEADGAVPLPLPPDLLDRLREVQSAHGVSWFMVTATALAALLHCWAGQDDLTFGCPVANRDGRDAVIGPCLDTVVLRSRRRPGATLAQSLRTMRETVLDAFEQRGVPFEAIVERLAPPRREGRTPFADVILNVNVRPDAPAEVGGCRLERLRFDSQWRHETKVGLTMTLQVQGGRLVGVLSYRGDRFAAADVRRLARALGALLEGFPDLLDRPLEAVLRRDDLRSDDPRPRAGASLPPAAGQYRDFVLGRLAAGPPEGGLGHWLERLDGAPAYPSLPPLRRPGPHGAVPVPLAPDVGDRLRRVQAERGVSRFMVVATALAALLHRWTGQDDVTFGCPVATRDRPELREVVGPVMNTIVLRSRCERGTTLGDLLRSTGEAVLTALEHQHVPFETVVERLNPPRRPGWTPYIDVTLAMQTASPEPARLDGRELVPLPVGATGADHVAKFGLTLGFVDAGDRVDAQLAYRGDRVTAADAGQLARLLGRLLERLPGSLDVPVHELDLLDGEERARLVRFERGAPAAAPTSVPALLARQLAVRPDAPAVASSRGTISLLELDGRAAALAARLRPLVRGRPPVVALVLGRGEDLVVAMLGAWKAGCCFCPLDPEYPDAHVDFILDDLDACAVATDEPGLMDRLSARGVPVVRPADAADAAGAGPAPPPDPESIAYVLYTSGTTGRPKGVAVRHRSLAQFARWYLEAFDVGPGDRCSHVSSVGFDASLWEVWPTLCAGGCVVPYERPAVVATELAPWLDQQGVTLSFAPTPLAEALWSVRTPVRRLRRLFFAGSALTRRPPPGLAYVPCNTYGPTETTIIVTAQVVDPEGEAPLNCIGRPIAGARLLVLDGAGRRCPVGVPGEIHIGGAGVGAGYWRRPELTEERFVAAGPDGEPGPLYRTGDQGRWLADGTLEFLGRRDRQLKISGYRVEPQEVEAHLREDPLVEHALARGHAGETTSLVAYLVPRAGAPRDTRAVLARLETRLPGFMVPDAVIWLDQLPLSVHGKVAADRLPVPSREDRVGRTPWVAPASDLERRIAAVWSSVLGVDAVGVHDNFFDLGGNSLLLASLHDRLREELSPDLPIQRLFEHPTVHTLARALAGGGPAAGHPPEDDPGQRAARGRQARAARRRAAGGR
jgi:amino acid adenylation domain-containing protein